MITKKTGRGIALLILLTSVSFWATRDQRDDQSDPVSGLDPKLNYVLRDFELQAYDKSGKTTLNMKAPVLSNNPVLEMGTIEDPVLILHQAGITWNLTAESATITRDKEFVSLRGSVYIQRIDDLTDQQIELNTSDLELQVTPQTADTVEHVSMFDGLNHIDAVGMQINMMNDTFKLKQQVKATYAVN